MADYAWVSLRIWPWNDEWLAWDTELQQAFADVDLLENEFCLKAASQGDIDVQVDDKGPVPFKILMLSGEMKGGSYQIREESTILECLQERNIAFYLSGDAKYDWDGDETWWYPGRDKVFSALAGESGRFLDESAFHELKVRCMSVADRMALVNDYIRTCLENVEKLEADDRNRVAEGKPTIGDHSIPVWKEAIVNHKKEYNRLLSEMPVPESLADLVTEFFAADPFAWRPDVTWRSKLKKDLVEVET